MAITLDLSGREAFQNQVSNLARVLSGPNDPVVLANVLGDVAMYLEGSDASLTPNLVRDGYWESWITLACARVIRRGMICVDVGANCGYYSALFAKMGANIVIAMEPNPYLAAMMKKTFSLNIMPNVLVAQVAAGGTFRTDKLIIPQGNWGISGFRSSELLVKRFNKAGVKIMDEVEVSVVTLDYFLKELDHVDFIKVDVETAEREVWHGMQKTLARNPQCIVCMEVSFVSGSRDYAWTEFADEIRDGGWTIKYVDYDGSIIHEAKSLNEDVEDAWGMIWITNTNQEENL
jgi:FkbM family methyltransferase